MKAESVNMEVDMSRGYDVTLVSKPPDKFKCPFCNLLMRDAIQTYRGEMACESCYESAKGTNTTCPIDKEPIESNEYFKDRHTQREILQLLCYCSNKRNGCTWEGVVNDVKDHLSKCLHVVISCDHCWANILRKDFDDHKLNQCRFRKMKCSYCFGMYAAESLQEHESTCHLKPMECPYLCGEAITLENIYNHVGNCPQVSAGTVCPYQLVSCKYQPKSKDDLNRHLQSDSIIHAALTVSVVKYQQESSKNMKSELLTEQTLRLEMVRKVEQETTHKNVMESELVTIKDKLECVEKECVDLRELYKSSVQKVENDLKEIELRTQGNNLRDMDAKLTQITQQYEEVESQLSSAVVGLSAPGAVVSEEVKRSIEAIDQLESGSAVLSANFSDLELKLQLLENTSYAGQQLWKVDNIAYRMNQAVTGKVTALHSAPCFQTRGGYKFCSRLYLNGDGMGRGTHVSLFFVVMKSEYDALLEWPFSQRVTFRLISPRNKDASLQESFMPDRNSSSFKKPTKDMNIAAGCPMFIKKENLDEFLVDDVLYIETVIA